MGERFDATTEHLRDAARALLLERGARAFTLEALAKSAFVSIGAVYERWGSRPDALADLADTRILPALAEFAHQAHAGREPIHLLLDDEAAGDALRVAVELFFAARDDTTMLPLAEQSLRSIEWVVAGDTHDDLTRYTAMMLIGFGLLQTGGCDLPPLADDLAALLADRPDAAQQSGVQERRLPIPPDLPYPPTGQTTAADPTGEALRESTRRLLAHPEPRSATARSIATGAGVTTGAIYRRFDSTSDLLVDVLMSELQGHRYAWMDDLADALHRDDPIRQGAGVMARALSAAIADSATNRMLLEITVTARTDSAVRAKVVTQIEAVAQSRVVVFEHLQRAGLVRTDIRPQTLAWLLQAPPIGGRLLGSIGLAPSTSAIQTAIEQVTARALA